MASLKVASCVVVIMCMMAVMMSAPMMVQAVSCDDVIVHLSPCLFYLIQGGSVPDVCCNGVRNIMDAATNTSDKQTVCKCLQQDAINYGINEDYAEALPGLCNVNLPYKISRFANCDDIRF